jgi:hypothetical protein
MQTTNLVQVVALPDLVVPCAADALVLRDDDDDALLAVS